MIDLEKGTGLVLWRNCDVYAPEHIGRRDILSAGGKIALVEEDLSRWELMEGVETADINGAAVCPGIIDGHMHITGGGGEQGPTSRVPEAKLSEIIESGITTVVGLTGTDCVSRSMENLLFKCRALNEEGITAFMLTGGYRYPSPTVTGDVMRDISLIGEVIGVKLALSDHRSSGVTVEELIRLASEARIGGLISGKPGILVMHMGPSDRRFAPIFEALRRSDVPAGNLLPTHCCRTPELVADAVSFAKLGGTFDVTASECEDEDGTAKVVMGVLRDGTDPSRITMSSDAYGSQPRFNDAGECVGLTYASPNSLMGELRRFVFRYSLPLETALGFFTKNPARVLGLEGKKGAIVRGADADILALTDELKPLRMLARGKTALVDGCAVMKGRFE